MLQVGVRVDMLPKLLTTDICSLRSGVDRLAFSVVWVLGPDCRVKHVEFFRSIIHSCASLTYGEAQTMADDSSDCSGVAEDIRTLLSVAKTLRSARVDRGALTLASPEVRFELDNNVAIDKDCISLIQINDDRMYQYKILFMYV